MANLQREQEIMELLKEKNYATVEYLSKKIHTSPSSIRRDLTLLEQKGLVKRSHGGVSLLTALPGMAPFSMRLHEKKKEKMAIAKIASGMILPGSSLYLDSSTIALNLYPFLHPQQDLTIFTNNIQLAQLLASRHIPTYCVGGFLSGKNHVITTGSFASSMLDHIYTDFMFFSSAAISLEGIILDHNEEETAIRKRMLPHAKQKIFLCDRQRFGLNSRFLVTDAGSVDAVVTDLPLPKEFCGRFPHTQFLSALS